jgi:alkaline phosphatase
MLRKFFSRKLAVIALALFLGLIGGVNSASAHAPRYVFYFIGDGMGAAQRQAAEYYLRAETGVKDIKLRMNQFPVAGINTTYSADSLVTDSAAAGTALAAGYKTNNGIIAQLPDGTNVKSLVEAAEEKGMGTGLVTTTRITHATPAVFASHNSNRDAENEIALDYLDSGVDFFAGGGYRHFVPQNWDGGKSKRKDDLNIAEKFKGQGYHVFLTEKDTQKFRNYKPSGQEKVFAAFTYSHLPYELDRENDHTPSLAELTAKGIEVLEKYKEGFFLMVEGGRIDHACHAHDPAGSIHDTLAFDKALDEAYSFYQKYPDETLIVVVADHETGGFGLGFGDNYFLKMDQLFKAKVTTADVLNEGVGKYDKDRKKFFDFIATDLGLDNLSLDEKIKIEQAMDLIDGSQKDAIATYAGYDPAAITVTHIMSERANMFWTTYAHSGTTVPLSAIGVGAEALGGFKDNTEVARTLFSILEFKPTEVAFTHPTSLPKVINY